MKKIIFIAILISLFFLPVVIFANTGSDSAESILGEIKKSQNINENSQINCDKVSDDQLEKLGDSVMGIIHPNEKEHGLMDQMMGGEGSTSLKAAHIYMGKQYLGCVSGSGMMGGGGMMGSGGMMGYGSNYQNMMNWGGMGFGWNWLVLIFQFLFLFLIILAIVALIKWILTMGKR